MKLAVLFIAIATWTSESARPEILSVGEDEQNRAMDMSTYQAAAHNDTVSSDCDCLAPSESAACSPAWKAAFEVAGDYGESCTGWSPLWCFVKKSCVSALSDRPDSSRGAKCNYREDVKMEDCEWPPRKRPRPTPRIATSTTAAADTTAATTATTTAPCVDTPEWTNGWTNCDKEDPSASRSVCVPSGGWTCKKYESTWCENGMARENQEFALGAKFNLPEDNCCVCGKRGKPAGAPAQCVDTPGWHNGYTNCDKEGDSNHSNCIAGAGWTCNKYESTWCENGKAREGHQRTLGSKFRSPEDHCCACGKAR